MQTDSRSQWDHNGKKKTRQGATQKGIHVKPLTTYLQQDPHAQSEMTCINSLSARIHWWLYPHWCLSLLSDSELISSLFNLACSPRMSPFRQGGPEAVPAEHGIAAVHHSFKQCLLPEIYIIFARAPRLHVNSQGH